LIGACEYIKLIKPFHEIKYFFQRGRRGFSDKDMWSADIYMAGVFAGMLRWYVKNSNNVSMSWAMNNDGVGESHIEKSYHLSEKRDAAYIKYAEMFEEYAKNGLAWDEKWKQDFGGLTNDEVHDMMTWFGEHFTEFWD